MEYAIYFSLGVFLGAQEDPNKTSLETPGHLFSAQCLGTGLGLLSLIVVVRVGKPAVEMI